MLEVVTPSLPPVTLRLVYKALERVVEEIRKTVGEKVRLLEEEEEEGDEEGMAQPSSNLSMSEQHNMLKQLTIATSKRLYEQLKVSE